MPGGGTSIPPVVLDLSVPGSASSPAEQLLEASSVPASLPSQPSRLHREVVVQGAGPALGGGGWSLQGLALCATNQPRRVVVPLSSPLGPWGLEWFILIEPEAVHPLACPLGWMPL